jgi:heme/copper-type cytochrome/quinol oxidase subunit 3
MTVIPSRAELATQVSGSHSVGWWGLICLILNEIVLFASLIASYLYIRFNSPVWPPSGVKPPELILPVIVTVILLSSSVFMQIAQNGIKHDQRARLRIGLLLAFGLGIIFLGFQAYEYMHPDILPTDNAYGSLFFAITGIHGIHVLMAVLMNAYLQLRAALGHFSDRRYQGVENVTLYWHFVDVVWLFIVATLYISPHL